MGREKVGDHLNRGLTEEHPGLRGVNADVRVDGLELLPDEARRRLVHRGYLTGVLGGECNDNAHAVAALSSEGLQVSLDAGATSGVGARDGQAAGYHA